MNITSLVLRAVAAILVVPILLPIRNYAIASQDMQLLVNSCILMILVMAVIMFAPSYFSDADQ